VTVKGATVASGVTDLNPAVDLAGYLSAHIIPELSVTDAGINELPIVKAACLKFVATFRSQFSTDQLVALLPMLIPFVGSTNVVVHTYAAAAIERLLMVKDKSTTTDAAGLVVATTTTPRISPEAVAANLETLFGAFFGLMVKTGACRDDARRGRRCRARPTGSIWSRYTSSYHPMRALFVRALAAPLVCRLP